MQLSLLKTQISKGTEEKARVAARLLEGLDFHGIKN